MKFCTLKKQNELVKIVIFPTFPPGIQKEYSYLPLHLKQLIWKYLSWTLNTSPEHFFLHIWQYVLPPEIEEKYKIKIT